MYIKNIYLENYRNYSNLDLDFDEKVNILIGSNAQGKTNLIESIYLGSFFKSFRTNIDSELIKFGEDFTRLNITYVKDDEENDIELYISKDKKKAAKINGVKITKISELLDNIYIVIFSPEDLKIVKEEPEKRRKFIDRELCQIKPSYYSNLSDFKKIMVQRNNYLKEDKIDKELLDVWDLQLAKYGSRLIHQRKEFVDKIKAISAKIHLGITNNKENLVISYDPNIKYIEDIKEQEQEFYNTLKASLESDLRNRTTTRGPQKDDIKFYINDVNVRKFGSQGQQRTSALSLKLAEIELIKEEKDEEPILLLDDVLSELDDERQEYLIKTLEDVQLFITTTDIKIDILKGINREKVYKISQGQVEIQ
ncbi:MAG: DNA replication/repair protein RecF [Clostridia bacterium]|nr:DNA replication/repair protein RecF [Clostridia bacterium]